VTSWESQCEAFKSTTEIFGPRIDYVFANAGISQMTAPRQNDPTHYAISSKTVEEIADSPPDLSVINVNLTGVLYTVYLALAYFRRQEKDNHGWRGKIVATGSTACVALTFYIKLETC
jgi:NAD(P)-dependent dehydrogenase (short-subunit alcohol dehydrogenase family)